MKIIDLRSDTVTLPTDTMRSAMANALVGDDVYEDDPTVKELEKLAAKVTGKEAALFVSSGTQGNLLGIWSQTNRGDEVILGRNSHVMIHEVGGIGAIAQCITRTIDHPDDMIYPSDIEKAIRGIDIHEPVSTLLCLENALANGKVVPLDLMKKDYELAKNFHLNVHLDGARIFNAATTLNCDIKDIAQYTDTLMFCLSKGLCAPIGSMLCGPKETIEKARRLRKMIGGGTRQAGIIAAAGIIAINEMTKRLQDDHTNAKYLAKELDKLDGFHVHFDQLDINMVYVDYDFDAGKLHTHLLNNNIKANPAESGLFRFVTHYWITKEDIDQFIKVIKAIK